MPREDKAGHSRHHVFFDVEDLIIYIMTSGGLLSDPVEPKDTLGTEINLELSRSPNRIADETDLYHLKLAVCKYQFSSIAVECPE